jgi:mono/diheme cytochrome c family protein
MRKNAAEEITVSTRASLYNLWNRLKFMMEREWHEFTRPAKPSNTCCALGSEVDLCRSSAVPSSTLSAASKLVLAITVIGLGIALAQNPSYHQDPKWQVPADAATKPNPLAQRLDTSAGGKKLFQRNCVECHGSTGIGVEKKHAADLQLPAVQQQSDGALFWKITNGNTDRGMPSFSRLPELQRWQLVLYLRTLKPASEVQSNASAK